YTSPTPLYTPSLHAALPIYLRRKLDAGASRALTQFFFSPETFFRFRDRASAAGITAPIVPGILPVTNFAQTRKIGNRQDSGDNRSEEHTSELQSRGHLVCRL